MVKVLLRQIALKMHKLGQVNRVCRLNHFDSLDTRMRYFIFLHAMKRERTAMLVFAKADLIKIYVDRWISFVGFALCYFTCLKGHLHASSSIRYRIFGQIS